MLLLIFLIIINIKVPTTSLSCSKRMFFLKFTWILQMAFKAFKSTKFISEFKNEPFYMCIVSVFLDIRISLMRVKGFLVKRCFCTLEMTMWRHKTQAFRIFEKYFFFSQFLVTKFHSQYGHKCPCHKHLGHKRPGHKTPGHIHPGHKRPVTTLNMSFKLPELVKLVVRDGLQYAVYRILHSLLKFLLPNTHGNYI